MKKQDVVITGIGLVSSLGEGPDLHWDVLSKPGATPVLDEAAFAPFPVHPLPALSLDRQIPKKGDQRQMEPWQRLGTYAAGLALADAGVAGNADLLGRTHMIVAAGGGERDIAVDEAVMAGLKSANDRGAYLNERLASDLRPTLFLAQLSNLLAGNISIVHGVTGSSRTFMGEESAGLDAVRTLAARIRGGQADLGLVGAAYSAPRADMQLVFGFGDMLWRGDHQPVWARAGAGGGLVPGSIGAFLVLEAREHARERGRAAYAALGPVLSERTRRGTGDALATGRALLSQMRPALPKGSIGVLSGATGVAGVTAEEHALLAEQAGIATRATGSRIGHGVEAAFPANLALAALAVSEGRFPPPFEPDAIETPLAGAPAGVLVTSFGHWRGEGLALVTPA